MFFYIVIPVHNEEKTIGLTLKSLVNQTLQPKRIVVVNDNSDDNTQRIVEDIISDHSHITLVNITSSNAHIPGSKVVNAFYKGLETLDDNYNVICKFDGDIILPENYLECINQLFQSDSSIGIAGGLAYVKKDEDWVYENISNKDHVRGPFKAYRKSCFQDIDGIKSSIGWDTLDTLLAKYYNWNVAVDKNLHVKHLKPTGFSYNKASRFLQGEALYKMRYGIILTILTALKMALKKRSFKIFTNYIRGYFKAKSNNLEWLVTENQGQFIRKLRWNGILNKLS